MAEFNPVPPLAIGRTPLTLLVKSMEPASMAFVTFPAPMVVVLPELVTSPVKFALVVTVAALPVIDPEIVELKVCVPVNVCAASVRAIVASVDGNVIVLPSVPARVKLLFDVSVFPSAMVRVAEVEGAVIVTLLTLVAVATPMVGVTKVGLVSITNLVPVPVCEAIEVAFPVLVMGPVKFALVALAVVIELVTNSVVAI